MAIGIVSDEEFERETRDELPKIEDKKPEHGRSPGDVNVPDSLRKIIGETAIEDGRQSARAIARMFGISDSSVSAYTNGASSTSSYNKPKLSLVENLNKARHRVTKRATKTLSQALDGMTPEKMQDLSARHLAGIAKDMSAVIRNMEPQQMTEREAAGRAPQFVIFAPQFRDEHSFEVIDVQGKE